MKFRILTIDFNGRSFKIEEDYPEVGVYLYVFEGQKCIKDYLQNDVETCKKVAFEDYEVPVNEWKMKDE